MNGAIDLLFGTSEVRRQILAAFYAGPGLVTHPRELARRLGHPSQVVGRELQRREDAGILASETIGRARRYHVNAASPIAADVRGLVLRTIGVDALIAAALSSVTGVEGAWILGSHARGRDGNVVAYPRLELADLESAGDPFVVDVLAGPRTRLDIIETG